MISKNVLDHVLERFRSLFNGFEHSKLYVVGLDGMGYLLGPTLRAPYGANNASWRKGLLLDLNDGSLPFHRLTNGWLPLKNH